VDLIFVKCKAKTARRLTYGQFLDALSALATVKFHDVDGEGSHGPHSAGRGEVEEGGGGRAGGVAFTCV
jgi:hypothetical protein